MTGADELVLTPGCEWCGSPGFTRVHGRMLCVDDGVELIRAVRAARAAKAAAEIVAAEPDNDATAGLDAEVRQWEA